MSTPSLLEIKNLRTEFRTENETVTAVNGISFSVNKGETIGIVGESGSGKSVTSLSIMRLIASPPGKITGGELLFNSATQGIVDLASLPEKQLRKLRGNEIAMIFQEPMTSLSPLYTVGNQIMEVLMLHLKMSKQQARARCVELLKQVEIPNADKAVDRYTFEFSGGMRQRVMIAMALSCKPELLIADEPTTALDVTTQARILQLVREMQEFFLGLRLAQLRGRLHGRGFRVRLRCAHDARDCLRPSREASQNCRL